MTDYQTILQIVAAQRNAALDQIAAQAARILELEKELALLKGNQEEKE